MHNAYIIIDQGYLTLVDDFEQQLNGLFRNMRLDASASSYYDEFVEDGIEYGVKICVKGLSQENWSRLLLEIERYCVKRYGHQVRVVVF